MFFHIFKNELKATVREKSFILWMFAFPLILATFFHVAFGDIYEADTLAMDIKTAIVENTENPAFNEVVKTVSAGDEALFEAKYLDEKSALKLLEENEIDSIIYVDEKISMTVAPKGDSQKQAVLKEFLDSYRINEAIIMDTMANNPQKINDVMTGLTAEFKGNENGSLTDANMDVYETFFFNLIAMVALFGSTTGLGAAISNQANLSSLAARRGISPVPKLTSIVATLLAKFLAHSACIVVAITYIKYILGHDLGDNTFMIYLSGIIGTLTGVSLGFFMGSIGRVSENIKISISCAFSMILCFFSGLMVGNMKMIVEENFPLLNRISPAALTCDLYYCLNMYDNYEMYIEKAATLIIISVVFIFGGFLLTRRKKYASL